ncbi:hypothetical protein [Candidatus Amarolinea dominans]|uniref:hypothetical protein n=1 Tax=Candidatus Amarolinea dominans TaxID=3140696 RepID=UPI001D4D0A40|nr:hypothetical protein [Anaerolineae bacterium]
MTAKDAENTEKKEVFALFVLSVVKYVLQDDRKGRREHREKGGFALFVLSVVKYVLQDDRKGRREHREKRGLCALCALCGQIRAAR